MPQQRHPIRSLTTRKLTWNLRLIEDTFPLQPSGCGSPSGPLWKGVTSLRTHGPSSAISDVNGDAHTEPVRHIGSEEEPCKESMPISSPSGEELEYVTVICRAVVASCATSSEAKERCQRSRPNPLATSSGGRPIDKRGKHQMDRSISSEVNGRMADGRSTAVVPCRSVK